MPPDEAERLATLHSYGVMDSETDARFDAFARLAAHLVGTPIALVTLVGQDRQWFKARFGLDAKETPRDVAFCAHAILEPNRVMVVEDASADARFIDNPLVTSEPRLRFYAGAPIVDRGGHALGTLCVADHLPRKLAPETADALADLAKAVASAIELRANLETAQEVALHDPLTGLANRSLFEKRLSQCVARAQARSAEPVAVYCLDLDRFKAVNDLLGHAGGDALLREAARRLSGVVRAHDTVARLGGDEFAVLLAAPVSAREADALGRRLIDALEAPFEFEGQPVPIRTSVGYALCPADGLESDTLLRRADAALYEAKHQGRGRHIRFAPTMEGVLAGRQALEADLRTALANGDFTFAWQPVAEARTGRVIACEALLRWNRQGHGPVPPSVFVAVAEACGLGGALDDWVLREACRAAATWPTPLPIAVNVSAARFHFGGLVSLVAEVLQDTGLPAQRLELEVTEGTLIKDQAAAASTLEDLRAFGVRVALDDFGTGYSSLGYLHALPLDKVKLDRSFIADIDRNERARTVVRAALQLCRGLGIKVCAEGVETEGQLAFLRDSGCDQVQGYLIGRPNADVPMQQDPPQPVRPDSDRAEAQPPARRFGWLPRYAAGLRMRSAVFAGAALVPLFALSSWHFEDRAQERIAVAQHRAGEVAASSAREVDSLVARAQALLLAASQISEVRDAALPGADPAPCQAKLAEIASATPWQRALALIAANGEVVCRQPDDGDRVNLADQPHLGRAVQTRSTVLSDVIRTRRGDPALFVLQPIASPEGGHAFTLSARLDTSSLLRALGTQAGAGFEISLVDVVGRVVARPDAAADDEGGTAALPGLAASVISGTLRGRGSDGRPAIFGVAPISGTTSRVAVAADEAALLREIERQRWISYIVLGTTGLALLILWLNLSELLVLRPLRELRQAVDRLASGDLTARVGLRDRIATPELIGLAERVDEMAAHLSVALEAAGAASATKTRFLGAASHELRTPLNGILGWAQLLLRDRRLSPDQHAQVKTIADAGEHLAAIVGRLLEISAIEAGKAEALQIEAVNPSELARQCVQLVRPGAEEKGLVVGIEIAPGIEESVRLDSGRTRQVLLNLLGNAIKFTTAGSVTLELTQPSPDLLRFVVRDTGPGVAPHIVGRLFNDFVRFDPAGRGTVGSGLGLAVCARIAALLGGSVRHESTPNMGGSTFAFELPIVTEARAPEAETPTAPEEPRPASDRRLRLLAVDDVATNLALLRATLALSGHDVEIVTDGNAAIEAVAANGTSYDAVLMDVQMPGIDGLEATRRIRALRGPERNVPVIAVTAGAFREDVQACLDAGMNGHIEKPVREAKLLAMLARLPQNRVNQLEG